MFDYIYVEHMKGFFLFFSKIMIYIAMDELIPLVENLE